MQNILITCKANFDKHGQLVWLLENNWYKLFSNKKINLIPVTPDSNQLNEFFRLKPKGIIFSGGNDLNFLSKKKANLIRDKFELKMLKKALKYKIPILGVCRGFQLIAHYYKSKIYKKKNHVRTTHSLKMNNEIGNNKYVSINVNSFHNYVILTLPKIFDVIVKHKDNTIELAYSKKFKILSMMFHPERKNRSQANINKLVFSHLKI
jgi:N5-(cytidine 5'-diphosphoramidyl)-L-glutamine hydrolase|tara:strand:+ start:169 stop:789 length:621 start_codon:yes stop_codon:yes gene_type:complete